MSFETYITRRNLEEVTVCDIPDAETGEFDSFFARCACCELRGNCTEVAIWSRRDGTLQEWDTVSMCESCRYEAEYGPDAE